MNCISSDHVYMSNRSRFRIVFYLTNLVIPNALIMILFLVTKKVLRRFLLILYKSALRYILLKG